MNDDLLEYEINNKYFCYDCEYKDNISCGCSLNSDYEQELRELGEVNITSRQ